MCLNLCLPRIEEHYKYAEIMPKHNISPSTRFFPHKERYEIFDGKIVEKFKIFVQDFVPIRTALTIRQPMVEFYLLTFPRFPLRKKERNSYFGKNRTHDFRTSRCAGWLLDGV